MGVQGVFMLQGRALIAATKVFAQEQRGRSWWVFLSTLVGLVGLMALTVVVVPWWGKLGAGVLAGLMFCRMFIIYHDHQHGAIFRGSRVMKWVMSGFGVLILNPPSTWNSSHNHHHKHNTKIRGASIGSFPVMTVKGYEQATWWEKTAYAGERHPLTIMLAWVSVFFYSMTLRSLIHKPRQHMDCGLAVVIHVGVWIWLAMVFPTAMIYSFVVPLGISTILGAYLFYAQHNYPAVDLGDQSEWDYVNAALKASSFMDLSPVMHWFTGNIGYHHIHHLNSRIPFYRLPEAMAALAELQSPGKTDLSVGSIWQCLRLKLWDEKQGKMVGFNGR